MEADLALLNNKIDQLTAQIEAQNQQIELLVQAAQAQKRQIAEFQELKGDLLPIANHMVKIAVNELADVGSDFKAEDLLHLLKRTLRDTQMIVEGLDRLEMMMDLYDEIQEHGQKAFHQLIMEMDRLERKGYFAFAQQGWRILERIVSEFSEDDVKALGDNIVLILNTVKDMTQPEIMGFVRNTLMVAEKEIDKPVDNSIMGLLRQMREPEVRHGLALTMRVLHVIGAQATNGNGSKN